MIHLLVILLSTAYASQPTLSPASPEKTFECARTMFAEVEPKQTEEIKNSFMIISSLPYAVDVVEKRKSTEILRISYHWPQGRDTYPSPANPQFAASVIGHLRGYKTKRIWSETVSKYCY